MLRMPMKRQLELRKAMDVLQHEIMNIGVTLMIPRPMRLRMRGDDPEIFTVAKRSPHRDEGRVAENMVNCREWVYLDRLL
ncbi:hypothetical protein [Oligoflexus tunisiensis]|uniref:hypothetical protein n=1 Tax=Oligoflexus tunisiensis TaxID=708132 RepID=UPI00114CAC57|nr:hypothetical protein [Oligoflexus tunisiensis]